MKIVMGGLNPLNPPISTPLSEIYEQILLNVRYKQYQRGKIILLL